REGASREGSDGSCDRAALFSDRGQVETQGSRAVLQNACRQTGASLPSMTTNVMRVADLDTPALLIDLDIMEGNLTRLAAYGREHDLRIRPHTKTHKIPALGRKQLDLGAAGLTVAKVGEAEVMLGADPPDLLVAYPVIGRRKLERLMQ